MFITQERKKKKNCYNKLLGFRLQIKSLNKKLSHDHEKTKMAS